MKKDPDTSSISARVAPDSIGRLNVSLLRSLQALLTFRSVSSAAAKLGIFQPAMSRNLSSLRNIVGDELLVRSGGQMILTPRAEALKGVVDRVLADMVSICEGDQEFEPRSACRAFHIATYDFLPSSFYAEFVRLVTVKSPGSTLSIHAINERANFVRNLSDGELDVAITSRSDVPGSLRAVHLFTEPMVCVVRPGHILLSEPTTQHFNEASYVSSLEQSIGNGSATENLLSEAGLRASVAVRTQYLGLIPAILEATNLVFVTGKTLGRAMANRYDLRTASIPLEVRQLSCYMVWHERTQHDKAATWLRAQIGAAVADIALAK
jgi:DNA-binding transcriptional LysR family regulator